ISLTLLWWRSQVIGGLLLAIPLAALTARPDRRLRALGLLTIPEEREVPEIVARANRLLAEMPPDPGGSAVELLFSDPALLDLHRRALVDRARRRGEVEVDLVVALAKLEGAGSIAEGLAALTPRAKRAVRSTARDIEAC